MVKIVETTPLSKAALCDLEEKTLGGGGGPARQLHISEVLAKQTRWAGLFPKEEGS